MGTGGTRSLVGADPLAYGPPGGELITVTLVRSGQPAGVRPGDRVERRDDCLVCPLATFSPTTGQLDEPVRAFAAPS